MKNKSMLVSVGREKLHITVTTDLGTTNIINTHELHMTDAKNTTNLIYDMYFNEGINRLFIDRTGSGLVIIDSLVGKFRRAGYKYDYERGTVQPMGKEELYSEDFLFNFFKLVMEKLDISLEEINEGKLNENKSKWDLSNGLSSEVSKIINEKWLELLDKRDVANASIDSSHAHTPNIIVNITTSEEFNVESLNEKIMKSIKRGKGIR